MGLLHHATASSSANGKPVTCSTRRFGLKLDVEVGMLGHEPIRGRVPDGTLRDAHLSSSLPGRSPTGPASRDTSCRWGLSERLLRVISLTGEFWEPQSENASSIVMPVGEGSIH